MHCNHKIAIIVHRASSLHTFIINYTMTMQVDSGEVSRGIAADLFSRRVRRLLVFWISLFVWYYKC